MNATSLEDQAVSRPDDQRVVKILQRKGFRMPEAVLRLHGVFPDQVMRRMTIISSGDRMMTGLGPTVVMIAHDVAIHTGRRIVAQVGKAFAIRIGVSASARHDPDQRAEDQSGNADA